MVYKPYPQDGLVTFGASGTAMCDAQLFFKNAKVKAEKSDDLPFRGRQRRMGSAIVEYLQLDLIHMPKVLRNKATFKVKTLPTGEYAFEDAAQVRKVFEYDGVKFAITAKPDGILDYYGTDIIFEFKTKATGIKAFNSKLDYKGAQDDHVRQVIAESLLFDIRERIIVYESTQKPSWFDDANSTAVTKGQKTWIDGKPVMDLRAFYGRVTEEMQESLLADLAKQAKLVYDGVKPDITVEMTGKCGFCPYYGGQCQSSLSAENLAELREIEARYARSSMAGKVDHRNLSKYLAEVAQ